MENTFVENKKKYIGVLGAFALSVGASIGWGSFVITSSTYLNKAGLLGSIIGIVLGTLLMCIIAYCYHYMMNKIPDSGGIYSFVKHTFNGDHAFLASWFLIIVYIGILWANVTSIALFSRYLLGGVFQFGRLYSIAGYDVYIGEVLLCVGVLFAIGGLTFLNKKITTNITFGLVFIFIAAIIFVALFCLIKQNGISFQDVAFAPTEDSHFGQIMSVLAMSPWAFIGFESISHSTGSLSFKTKRVIWVLLTSLVFSAVVYILLCQISVMAHPENYTDWHDYVSNNHEDGIMGIPPFFVANYYLGTAGVIIFGIALFTIIATSIIGNIYAVSNLVQRMAEDEIFPKHFAYVNKNDIPIYVRFFVIGLTALAVFLGRSAIGFIVDVNNIGGVIVYGYIGAAAFFMGLRKKEKLAMVFGVLAFLSAIVFGVAYLAPVFSTAQDIAQETFMMIVICSLLGFAFFSYTLKRDKKGNFGNSSVVWVGFSILVVFFSCTWIIERSKKVHEKLLTQIEEYYASIGGGTPDKAYLKTLEDAADKQNMFGMITVISVVSLMLIILFITLYFVKENEKKYRLHAEKLSDVANRDALTGVQNHRAYIMAERRILGLVSNDSTYQYAIVVCDLNDLKYVNDKYGHDAGDEYLRKASQMICNVYNTSPVYRVGGDEFVVILVDDEFKDRDVLISRIKDFSLSNIADPDGVVIAVGMATRGMHEGFHDVFRRADKQMYINKSTLKKKRPSHTLR